jgi:hypothetical protein
LLFFFSFFVFWVGSVVCAGARWRVWGGGWEREREREKERERERGRDRERQTDRHIERQTDETGRGTDKEKQSTN